MDLTYMCTFDMCQELRAQFCENKSGLSSLPVIFKSPCSLNAAFPG